jgi:hypothetical protein
VRPISQDDAVSVRFLRTPRHARRAAEGIHAGGLTPFRSSQSTLGHGRAGSGTPHLGAALEPRGHCGSGNRRTQIGDALRSSPSLRRDVVFCDLEVLPLLEAAKSHPPTWARLVDPGTLETVSRDDRRQLVATCLELIDDLAAKYEGAKLRGLLDDLERLRDSLQAMTGRELLHDAGDRVASGWSQGSEARALDGRPVDVLDADAVSWSLLGALQGAAFASPGAHVGEVRFAVAALAELITDPSLTHWNDCPERSLHEVRTVLARAESLAAHACSKASETERR